MCEPKTDSESELAHSPLLPIHVEYMWVWYDVPVKSTKFKVQPFDGLTPIFPRTKGMIGSRSDMTVTGDGGLNLGPPVGGAARAKPTAKNKTRIVVNVFMSVHRQSGCC